MGAAVRRRESGSSAPVGCKKAVQSYIRSSYLATWGQAVRSNVQSYVHTDIILQPSISAEGHTDATPMKPSAREERENELQQSYRGGEINSDHLCIRTASSMISTHYIIVSEHFSCEAVSIYCLLVRIQIIMHHRIHTIAHNYIAELRTGGGKRGS